MVPPQDPFRFDDETMPRRESIDNGDDVPPGRFSAPEEDLLELERRLNDEVDEDFFDDPRSFNTLHRVIDVLGLQMIDDATVQSSHHELQRNPAYRQLKSQQKVVDDAIEHMAVIHCADLNGSVIQVGKVARQFSDAVFQVRNLRKQVRDIQDTLGAAKSNKGPAASMSLRELWLKKLECEATLSLLDRLDVIRAAPARLDALLQPPCRIGAAVLCLSDALNTMFSDDVAQVQALHKIMEQLMLRKQRAEEILWDTLSDVLYLRTGNGIETKATDTTGRTVGAASSHSVSSESRYRGGMRNPFAKDDESVASEGSGASLFSLEDEEEERQPRRVLIPIPVIEAEIDLEADERRCLEELALSGMGGRHLPRYADPILALRILVECLSQLKRLDDVERILNESVEREVRRIIEQEQAKTFARLEKKRLPQTIRSLGKAENLKDFRRHLTGLLSSFGRVMVRLTHLAEILRFRIDSDRDLRMKIESPSTVMRSVLDTAYEAMQREVKDFLKACLDESEANKDSVLEGSIGKRTSGYERGLFSLGIVKSQENGDQSMSEATRNNVMEMPASRFVSTVLFSKTKIQPQARHALSFRRMVARWSMENHSMKKELASMTGEDSSAPSFKSSIEETAIDYLDRVIQKDLLPVLQEEAVNGTVKGLERRDGFEPILDRSLYARPNSNDPQDIDMCIACQTMYEATSPLFIALHRLPQGGEMYLPVVAVLEHVMLTFISRVKAQVEKLCRGKTALQLLTSEGKGGASFSATLERRKPFSLLLRAYSDGDVMEMSATADEVAKSSGMMPLSPPTTDTPSRQDLGDIKSEAPVDDFADDVEGEELIFATELGFIKPFFNFGSESKVNIATCSDEELMRASCLAHSLLKLASLLESRLKIRGKNGFNKTLMATRQLREAIKTIKQNGVKMAKLCRIDMLMQCITRLSKICASSTIVARDAVRIPSSVNDLGDYLTGASDNLREAAGSAVTAYTFSSLEQYIPFCLMQTVRTIASGKGVITKSPLTMNGIEALDRSGSVLYRDLKGATSFDNSFWDVELAAISFERSASFMAMMELEMEELVAYYMSNSEDFSYADFELMFGMTGPRRRGDVGRLHMLKRRR